MVRLTLASLLLEGLLFFPQFIIRTVPPNGTVGSCIAANCTNIGAYTLVPTFENIGVKLVYTNDSNTNNTATLQYRLQGSGTWLDTHIAVYSTTANWPDRRSTCCASDNSPGVPISNTANQNQFRASIVGLTPGQTYDVKVVISDPDGWNGDSVQLASVTMLSTSTLAPQSGTTYYLDTTAGGSNVGTSANPFQSFSTAMANSVCGDTLIIKATSGATANPTFNKGCGANNWYQIQCADQSVVTFSESGGVVFTVTGNAGLKVENCRFGTSTATEVNLTTSPKNIWLDHNYFVDMNTAQGNGSCVNYYESAIRILNGAGNITVTNNSFNESLNHSPCVNDHSSSGGGRVIMWGDSNNPSTAGRYIFNDNTMTGEWSDCVGNSPENETNKLDNSDFLRNTFNSGSCNDDTIQLEGSDINLRIGMNTLIGDSTNTACIANQTAFYGPIYYYRNFCDYAGGSYTYKLGGTEGGYWFHNTARITNTGGGIYCWGDSVDSSTPERYIVAVNNICKAINGAVLQRVAATSVFDYNVQFRSGTPLVEEWATVNYNTLANFQACPTPCQEANGLSADPSLDSSLHITTSSNAYNSGVIIPNFDGPNSAWPITHNGATKPSRGAYEVP